MCAEAGESNRPSAPALAGSPLGWQLRVWRGALARHATNAVQAVLLFAVRCYQLAIRPLLGQHCRFEPSCSRYAAAAIARHGPWRGVGLAVGRVLRCHPWHPGGFDPVPESPTVQGPGAAGA